MACLVCKKAVTNHSNKECFILMLDNLKLHYEHINKILEQRNEEIQRLQQHNEKLNKLAQLCQADERERKRVKKDQQNSPDQVTPKINHSASDDDVSFDPNLNIALHSEQLFDTSDLSPLTTNLHRSSSELIMSPRVRMTSKRNNQQDILRPINDRNLQASKHCNLMEQQKEQAKSKSWATKFLQSDGSSIKKDEISRRSDKKLSLSLKKQKNCKIKQTIMENYAKKKLSESTFCDEIIEASPAMVKTTTRTSKSCLLQSISEPDVNGSSAVKNIKNVEPIVSIDKIVFDFSPTKKADTSLTNENIPTKINFTPTQSTKKCLDVRQRCTDLNDSPNLSNLNNSSVIMLTPCTQDIIFIDDVTDENSTNINTMDLVRELKQSGTSTLKNFYTYESKCILKHPNKNIAKNMNPNLNVNQAKNGHPCQVPKPGGYIKVEKITQSNNTSNVEEQNSNNGVIQRHNCIESNQSEKEYDDDDDCMPRPIQIKVEVEDSVKTINIKEKYNIDCQKCEQYVQFFANHLSVNEIEDHLNKCPIHNRQHHNRTPEGFWNPHILSFPPNDERNKILFDSRLKNKKTAP